MSDSGWWIEIAFLAMLAGFIALRLVSVLGRRTGHENPVGDNFQGGRPEIAQPAPSVDPRPRGPVEIPADTDPASRDALQAIADADPSFEPNRFVDGAKGAYRMILESFWKGDAKALEDLVSDDVSLQFRRAIEGREVEGISFENRLVRIERATITGARMAGMMAEVTVRFDADIVAVTRDASGVVVAGSTSDAVQTHDVWTFSRHIGTADPNWLLIETDAE